MYLSLVFSSTESGQVQQEFDKCLEQMKEIADRVTSLQQSWNVEQDRLDRDFDRFFEEYDVPSIDRGQGDSEGARLRDR